MPASMIRPPIGSRWKVSGSSIAMVAIGPIPGRTPIKVPTRQPISANHRLAGVSATENPKRMLLNRSIASPFGPDGYRQPEPYNEDRNRDRCHHQGGNQGLDRPLVLRSQTADAGHKHRGDEQAQALDRQPEHDDAERDEEDWPGAGKRLGIVRRLLRPGPEVLHQDQQPEQKQNPGE